VVARGSATSMGPEGWNPIPEMGYGPELWYMNIGETLIPCTQMLRVVHAQDVHNHSIDDLCLVVYLGVERSGFSELVVQQ
jgi:hypothetical protein